MYKKSKFLTFLFSFIPGLGHMYLGFTKRGAIFLGSTLVTGFISTFLAFLAHDDSPFAMLLLIPLIWIIALVDSFSLVDRINMSLYNNTNTQVGEALATSPEAAAKQNKKIIAMLLSVVPGAGHLYLGLQRQGIELMASFFLVFFLTDWLWFSGFMILAPIIWFYGMFDVMHKVSGDREMKDEDILAVKWLSEGHSIIKDKSKAIGYLLIVIGVIAMLNRILLPIMESLLRSVPYISNNIRTGIVAILFILGGVKLITGSKDNNKEEARPDEAV